MGAGFIQRQSWATPLTVSFKLYSPNHNVCAIPMKWNILPYEVKEISGPLFIHVAQWGGEE